MKIVLNEFVLEIKLKSEFSLKLKLNKLIFHMLTEAHHNHSKACTLKYSLIGLKKI